MPPPDLLAEGEELVAGRRPVEEAFVARRPAHRLLVVPQRRQALERLVLHATSLRIPVVEVEGGTLTALAGFDGHQGIALAVEPRVYAGIDDVLARAVERGEPPFVLVLDSLEDPQNVGTLLRSAEAAGVHGVIFPTHRQAPLTPAAIKASAGAVEHLLLCPVDDLPGAMSDLRVRGLQIAAAEADAPLTAAQADLRGPLAIVVGSEGQGLSPAMRRRSDIAVRIPMRGAIGSLNAAVAGSILLFAAVAQRDPAGLGDNPARPVGAEAWPVRDEPPNPARRAKPTDRGRLTDQAKPARGQSVGLPNPEAPATEAATDPTARGRRRSAINAAHPGGESDPPVDDAAPKRGRRTKADTAGPTSETSPEQAKPRRTGKRPATSDVPGPDAPSEAAKPIRRRARRAAQLEPGSEPPTGSPEPAPGKAKRPRASRRATEAAAPPGAVKPTRRRVATKTTDPPPEATANGGSGDDLLPGGPDPGLSLHPSA
ncbi:MAG TPA: 23S rRNA (guanosine(2251)-2'-O)-methyltransferase RlmB [Candidatus Bathyarchaeia archaeon]|nr:23S rRNA (guanosine(2251)-2'-O)-methyltransferase RlmB [Candidatus Bathyarchaeia archaeon]